MLDGVTEVVVPVVPFVVDVTTQPEPLHRFVHPSVVAIIAPMVWLLVLCILVAEASLEAAVMSQPTEPLGKHQVAPDCNTCGAVLFESRSGLPRPIPEITMCRLVHMTANQYVDNPPSIAPGD